jgi:hypothetical protein
MSTAEVLSLIGVVALIAIALLRVALVVGELRKQVADNTSAVKDAVIDLKNHRDNPTPHSACGAHAVNLTNVTENIQEIKRDIKELSKNITAFIVEQARRNNGLNGNGTQK